MLNIKRTSQNIGRKHTEATKQKMKKIALEKGFGKWMVGKKQSNATKDKRSQSLKGRKLSEEHKRKIAQAHLSMSYGPLSAIHRRKIGNALRLAYAQGRRRPGLWNGGKYICRGYVYILNKKHPYKIQAGYVFEHRLIVEKIIGRYLLPEESVHHVNRKRNDNCPKNLMAFKTKASHVSLDKWGKENPGEIIFDGRLLK